LLSQKPEISRAWLPHHPGHGPHPQGFDRGPDRALLAVSGAHEFWIGQQNQRNPVTQEWCCGLGDCGIVMPSPKATAAGWAIHGEQIIDYDGRRIRVDEMVPYAETSPSPDGYFYRCNDVGRDYTEDGNPYDYLWDGKRRCFFAPPQSL